MRYSVILSCLVSINRHALVWDRFLLCHFISVLMISNYWSCPQKLITQLRCSDSTACVLTPKSLWCPDFSCSDSFQGAHRDDLFFLDLLNAGFQALNPVSWPMHPPGNGKSLSRDVATWQNQQNWSGTKSFAAHVWSTRQPRK